MATMISLRRNYTPGGIKLWNRGLMHEYVAYRNRVDADGGDIDSGSLTRQLLKFYKSEGRLSNIKLLWSAVAGTLVQSGTNPLQISKGYSADQLTVHNDLTQATSLNQPYGVGQIQGLPAGLYNPNGATRYMTHPAVTFGSGEAWSITFIVNDNSQATGSATIMAKGASNNSRVYIRTGASVINLGVTFDNGSVAVSGFTNKQFIAKKAIHSIIYDVSQVKFFTNGIEKDTKSASGEMVFSRIMQGSGVDPVTGCVDHVLIQSGSLTATQVAAEHTLLRSIYPEIPSVAIGTQTWAVDNFRAVATPLGTVIPNVTDAAAWAALTTPAWCSFNNDPANDVIFGKIFNGYAKNLLYADMVTAAFGWKVSTKAQLQAIAVLGGDALRLAGTGYWNTDRGNNSTGFTALGGAMRNADGTFATLKDSATFWAGDATEALTITHNSDTATVAASDLKAGHSIRLTKL